MTGRQSQRQPLHARVMELLLDYEPELPIQHSTQVSHVSCGSLRGRCRSRRGSERRANHLEGGPEDLGFEAGRGLRGLLIYVVVSQPAR